MDSARTYFLIPRDQFLHNNDLVATAKYWQFSGFEKGGRLTNGVEPRYVSVFTDGTAPPQLAPFDVSAYTRIENVEPERSTTKTIL